MTEFLHRQRLKYKESSAPWRTNPSKPYFLEEESIQRHDDQLTRQFCQEEGEARTTAGEVDLASIPWAQLSEGVEGRSSSLCRSCT